METQHSSIHARCRAHVASLLLASSFIIFSPPLYAELSSEIKEALNWSLPAHNCKQVRRAGLGTSVINQQGLKLSYGTYSNKINRFKRKEKRRQKCLTKYKAWLKTDFNTLQRSARFGLTKSQAKIILKKMALIQSALGADDGKPSAQGATKKH